MLCPYATAGFSAYEYGSTTGNGSLSPETCMVSVQSMFDNIDSKLRNIDSTLLVLDNIDKQVTELNGKIASIDRRVTLVETQVNESSRQLTELQTRRALDSQTCDDIKCAQSDISRHITDLNITKSSLGDELKSVSQENTLLNEQLLHLQSRSMRDNLLFHNIEECDNRDDRAKEDCIEKLHTFCEHKLNIPNAKDIKIRQGSPLRSFPSKQNQAQCR